MDWIAVVKETWVGLCFKNLVFQHLHRNFLHVLHEVLVINIYMLSIFSKQEKTIYQIFVFYAAAQ